MLMLCSLPAAMVSSDDVYGFTELLYLVLQDLAFTANDNGLKIKPCR